MLIDIMSVLTQAKGPITIRIFDPQPKGTFDFKSRHIGKLQSGELYYGTRDSVYQIKWYWYDDTVKIHNPTTTDLRLLADIMALPALTTIDPSLIGHHNQRIVLYTEDHEITIYDSMLMVKRSGRIR